MNRKTVYIDGVLLWKRLSKVHAILHILFVVKHHLFTVKRLPVLKSSS